MEKTYVMIKPDGVQRGLVGKIIKRFETAGLQLIGLKMCIPTEETLAEHYSELTERPFFSTLVAYVSSGPVVCMAWKGVKAVSRARNLIGKTDPANATSGTIRADMAAIPGRNVIHGADSTESAEKEISIWFGTEDGCLSEWEQTLTPWIDDGTSSESCEANTEEADEKEGEAENEDAEGEEEKGEENEDAEATEE